jgi:hypothetical protein
VSKYFACEHQKVDECSDGVRIFCKLKNESNSNCLSCCIGCAHAINMTCTPVCRKVAEFYSNAADKTQQKTCTRPGMFLCEPEKCGVECGGKYGRVVE